MTQQLAPAPTSPAPAPTTEQVLADPAPTSPTHTSARPDPRLMALRRFALSLTVFTIAGHVFLGFEQPPVAPIAAVLLAYTLELLLESVAAWSERRPVRYNPRSPNSILTFLLPAHISALACAMLLYSGPSLWPYLLGTAVAISVKYLIKAPVNGRMRHTINPSNFGIAVVLVLFPWVGIAPPYMFTAGVGGALDWLIPAAILMLGTMLNVRLTKKWPLILAWVAGFAAQAIIRGVVLDHNVLAALAPMTGLAFVIYTNYMITDPGSTPSTPRGQVWFGLATAAVYGLLVTFHVVFGLFFALVIVCIARTALLWVTHLTATSRAARSQTRSEAVPA